MPMVYVKPRAGGRVRMPERNFLPMGEAGAYVPRVDYYERLIVGGDLVICDPPPKAKPTKPAEPPKGGSDV